MTGEGASGPWSGRWTGSLGLYVHVPLCSAKCRYCSFYSIPASQNLISDFISALKIEMGRVSNDPGLSGRRFGTLYIGGGTPSLLPAPVLEDLLDTALAAFDFEDDAEVTLESNPESFERGHARALGALNGGRLSLGAQSFCEGVLRTLGRRHDPGAIASSVELARSSGVRRISLDLIYGTPGETPECWGKTLNRAMDTGADHISSYCLSIEEHTPLGEAVASGAIAEPDGSTQREMYAYAVQALEAAGYERYEISNFARPGCRSRHNLGYWRRSEYLGLGPSAHSFLGCRRWGNVCDLGDYCGRLCGGRSPVAQLETISSTQAMEETVMLAMRTSDGLDLKALGTDFGAAVEEALLGEARPMIDEGALEMEYPRLRISPDHYFVSDAIVTRLLRFNDVSTVVGSPEPGSRTESR